MRLSPIIKGPCTFALKYLMSGWNILYQRGGIFSSLACQADADCIIKGSKHGYHAAL